MNNKRDKIILHFILLFIFGANTSIAQDNEAKWAIKTSYSLLQYSGELDNQFFRFGKRNDGFGLAASRYLSPSFDATMGLDYYRLNISGTIGEHSYKVNGNIFSPSILFSYKFTNGYLLPESSRLKPYLGAGIHYFAGSTKGQSHDLQGDPFRHTVDEVAFNYAAGVKYRITHKVSFFAEFTGLLATTDELDGASLNRKNDKFWGGRIGIFIKIGGPKDSDRDGVPDVKDECPDTPFGVEVDEKGCPLDRDGDGIPDYQDDCPDIPGIPEFNGCPDTDGDGIPDHSDDCPELPGIPKYNGCPDSDGDGVIDPKDFCPDTPPGVKVDEFGCPIDSDGDGLTDDVDQCPEEWGPLEYMGCPDPPDPGWPAMNEETPPEVYFETDKHDLSPEAEEELNKMVRFLMENPNMNIRLYGQADPRGSTEHNKALSARRVDAVKQFLMRKGIPESRINVRAIGEAQELEFDDEEKDLPLEQKFRKYRRVRFDTFFWMR